MSWAKAKSRGFISEMLQILLKDHGYSVYEAAEMKDIGCKLLFCASRQGSSIGVYAEVRRREIGKVQFEGASFLPTGKKGNEPGNLLERLEIGCKRLNVAPYIGLVVIQVEYGRIVSFLGEMETILKINGYERNDGSRCQIRVRDKELELYRSNSDVIYKEYPLDVGDNLFRRWGGYEA